MSKLPIGTKVKLVKPFPVDTNGPPDPQVGDIGEIVGYGILYPYIVRFGTEDCLTMSNEIELVETT